MRVNECSSTAGALVALIVSAAVVRLDRRGKLQLVTIVKTNAGHASPKKAAQKTAAAPKKAAAAKVDVARKRDARRPVVPEPLRIYRCCHCKYTSQSSLAVMRHLRTHTGERPFECPYCSKRFGQKATLRTHVRIHTGERPYQCGVCSRAFTQSGSLTDHLRLHTGERPFACALCPRSFAHKGHLTEHLRCHTGERPYRCITCNKSFARGSMLKKHARTHLPKEAAPSANASQDGTARSTARGGDPQKSAVPVRRANARLPRREEKIRSGRTTRVEDAIVDVEIELVEPARAEATDVRGVALETDSDTLSEIAYVDFEILEPGRLASGMDPPSDATADDAIDVTSADVVSGDALHISGDGEA